MAEKFIGRHQEIHLLNQLMSLSVAYSKVQSHISLKNMR